MTQRLPISGYGAQSVGLIMQVTYVWFWRFKEATERDMLTVVGSQEPTT
jgi:hypothetical protein